MKKIIEEYQDILLEIIATGIFFVFLVLILSAVYKLSGINFEFLL